MIQIVCKSETYIYNAYHMVKAFYPTQEITSCVEEKASNYVTVEFVEEGVAERERTIEITDKWLEDVCGDQELTRGSSVKKKVDRALYLALTAQTGKYLSWGMLMGVRPTKLVMSRLENGAKKEEVLSWYRENYFVSGEKAELAWRIAKKEKELLDRLDTEEGYSLYVAIPFCPTVCTYCSFSSGALSDWEERVEDYLKAICKELCAVAQMLREKRLNTIYIGGGTPTTLTAEQMDRLLTCIEEQFDQTHLLEYTVEAGRPDSITREKLETIKRHQVSRISINPQSMQQKTLGRIGRKHTVEAVYKAYEMAREIGFDNINMDLIAGLPGETLADVEDTLAKVQDLSPDSLTVHSLAIKRAAKMGQERRGEHSQGVNPTEPAGDIGAMIDAAARAAEAMDMEPYYLYRQKNIAGNFENVGYAKVDKAGIYNILIMEEKQSIVAVGAGASTKIVLKEPVKNPANPKKQTSLVRLENVKALDAYIARVDEMIERKGEWLWH